MPFAASERPALGVSLLKAHLRRQGVACAVAYLNLLFAERLGRTRYEHFVGHVPFRALPGEWAFAEAAWGRAAGLPETYVEDVLRRRWHADDHDVEVVEDARRLVPAFLDECLCEIPWGSYDLVGFSSSTSQNLASIALAERLKASHPDIPIAFGGADWQGVPGATLHERLGCVDFSCSGEADVSFPLLVHWLSGTPGVTLEGIPGLRYRRQGGVCSNQEGDPIADLDGLPTPDFSDFYEWRHRLPDVRASLPSLIMEASRGCWWAQAHPCSFCGMDDHERVYRAKSPGRVLSEIQEITLAWPARLIHLADTVVPATLIDVVVPALAQEGRRARLFLEVRPEITREQLRSIADARACIQPGIESLNDRILGLMHKGSRALENIRLLKWCKELEVEVYWNLLYAVPGERLDDYTEMFRLLPAIRFLAPPRYSQAISVDRYSPYFEDPTRHGIVSLEPLSAYRYLYPYDEGALRNIAYTFEAEFGSGALPAAIGEAVDKEAAAWRREAPFGDLRSHTRPDGRLTLRDTRPGAARGTVELDALDSLLYTACDEIAVGAGLAAWVAGNRPDLAARASHVDRRLDLLVEQRLMVRVGNRFLSLALPEGGRRRDD
jgi:ribosomal peptide maturation radical SAM protein 1